MINFAANLNKMINAGLGGPLDPPRTEVAVGHRITYTEASGAVASFETNVIAPVKNLRVTMEPIQAGSGDPSPENIRPITGRDTVRIWRKAEYDQSADHALTIQLGQTVYGGTVDVTSGKMTVTESKVIIDGSRAIQNGAYDGAENIVVRFTLADHAAVGSDGQSSADISICDTFAPANRGLVGNFGAWKNSAERHNTYAINSSGIYVGFAISDLTLTSATLVRAWFAEHPVAVCYKLEEPFIIQLTPAQLTTLAGENTVWSDAGEVSLEYPYYEETEGY